MQAEHLPEASELLEAFSSTYQVSLSPILAEIALESLEQYEIEDVRAAVRAMITSPHRIEFGQSPIGVLTDRVREMSRVRREAREEAEAAARKRITDPAAQNIMKPSEYLAANPDSHLAKYFRSARPKPTEEQLKKARESQLRAVNNNVEATG